MLVNFFQVFYVFLCDPIEVFIQCQTTKIDFIPWAAFLPDPLDDVGQDFLLLFVHFKEIPVTEAMRNITPIRNDLVMHKSGDPTLLIGPIHSNSLI